MTTPRDRDESFVVAVIGCGCIGAYVGGKLATILQGPSPQVKFLLTESSSGKQLKQGIDNMGGITIMEPGGKKTKINNSGGGGTALFSTDASTVLRDASLVVVATKRVANEKVLQLLDEHCCADTPALLFQNGLDAPQDFRKIRPSLIRPIFQCIVTINVVSCLATATFERTSLPNKLTVDNGINTVCPGTTDMLRMVGFDINSLSSEEFSKAQRGKLLINLWNAPNALSGVPSLHAFLNKGCCRLAAKSMDECLACYHGARLGYQPRVLTLMPTLLRLISNPVVHSIVCCTIVFFGIILSPFQNKNDHDDMIPKHPWYSPLRYLSSKAHASMWEDLQRHRETEVHYMEQMKSIPNLNSDQLESLIG